MSDLAPNAPRKIEFVDEPRTVRVTVEDTKTGKIVTDLEAQIVIIGIVPISKEGATENRTPAFLFYLGNALQLDKLLLLITRAVGSFIAQTLQLEERLEKERRRAEIDPKRSN